MQKVEELQELEFGRGFAYRQPLSIGLPSLSSVLLKQLVSSLPKCPLVDPSDDNDLEDFGSVCMGILPV